MTFVLIIILIIISIIFRQKIKKLKGKVKFLRSKIKELIEFGKKTKDKLEEQNKEFIDFKQEISDRLNNLEKNNEIYDQDVAEEVQPETEKLEEEVIADNNEIKIDTVEDKDSVTGEIGEDPKEQEVNVDKSETKIDIVEDKDSATGEIKKGTREQKQSLQEVSETDNKFEDLRLKTDTEVEETKEDIEKEIKKEQEKRNKNLRQVLAGKIFEPFDKAVWGKKIDFDFNKMLSFEYWLNKIGIALVLLGVIFLFKYSLAQGWITAPIKVFIGLLIGIVLEVVGLKIYKNRLRFGQVLIGGGISVLYTTGFAAFQLYDIIPYLAAFIFMLAVTGYAYYLSIRQEEMVLALIGFIGGIGTPFLLATGQGNLANLMLYLCFIVGGTALIYLYKGWQVLLWVSILGSWPLIALGLSDNISFAEKKSVQMAIIFFWLVFWLSSVLREILWMKNKEKWSKPSLKFLDNLLSKDMMLFVERHVNLIVIVTPLIALLYSMKLWNVSYRIWDLEASSLIWGVIAVICSMLYQLIARFLKRINAQKKLEYVHILMSFVLLTMSLVILVEGNVLIAALTLEAMALMLVSINLNDKIMNFIAHFIFIVVGSWLGIRLVMNNLVGVPVINTQAIVDIVVIICGIITTKNIKNQKIAQIYKFYFGHLAILTLLWRELSPVPNGYHLIAIAWSLEALAEYIVAKKYDNKLLEDVSHIVFGILLLWRGYWFMTETISGMVVFNLQSIADIIIIIIGFIMSRLDNEENESNIIYKFGSYLSIFGLAWRELSALPSYNYVMLAWLIEAVIIHFLAYRDSDEFMTLSAHYVFIILGVLSGYRLIIGFTGHVVRPMLNLTALVDLLIILTTLGISKIIKEGKRILYQIIPSYMLVGWLFRELAGLSYNYVILSWLIEGIIVQLIASAKDNKYFRLTGHFIFIILLGFWIGERILLESHSLFMTNISSLVNFVFIVSSVLITKKFNFKNKKYYLIGANLLFLGWLFRGLMYWGHSYIILAWLIETIVIHLIAKKKRVEYLTAFSHIVFAILSIWTLTRISLRIENYSSFMINLEMLTDLIVLGSTLLVGNKIIKKELRMVYSLVPHFIFLGWLYQFFSGLANGNHYTMWAWVIEGIIVYMIAKRKDDFNIELSAYSVFVALAIWIAVRIFKVGVGIPILNFAALTEMIILFLVLALIKLYDKNIELKYCKLLSALLLAGIFFREFKGLSNGYSYVVILWTIIGVWLYFDAQKNADGFMKISSQVIFGILASWILYRIFKVRVGTPIFNLKTLSDVLVVSCIALYAYFEDNRKKALGYGSFCYLSMLILFYKELVHLTNGQGYITVAWGIYAIAILVFGLRNDSKSFISTALGTLILIVVKLFMIDLANVKAIWKILLFIGFGVVLLIISYYLQILWKPKLEENKEIEQEIN